jgi:hypothetical protein
MHGSVTVGERGHCAVGFTIVDVWFDGETLSRVAIDAGCFQREVSVNLESAE